MMSRTQIYTAAALLFLIAFLAQVKLGGLGIGLEHAMLVMLIALAFVLDVFALTFGAVLAAWLLNWQPALGPELAVLVLIPFAVCFLREGFPGSFLVGYGLAVALGVGLLYVVADLHFITGSPYALLREVGLGLAWAAVALVAVRMLPGSGGAV
jgi:hypothetical protein